MVTTNNAEELLIVGVGGTMTVEIRTYKRVRKAVGESRIEWDGDREATVGAVLDEIAEEYGIDESELLVMKNGTHVDHLNGESTKIAAGDTLTLS